jgi:nicotinamide-nucleotide amidase
VSTEAAAQPHEVHEGEHLGGGRSEAELASWLVSALGEHGQTVAMAESLTGGLLTAALVEVPGASVVLKGGVVAYATELKHQVLGVDEGLLAAQGPVDPQVAAQMARGVRDLMGADWGVATTGVAGPGPQDGVPPGRAFIGVAGPDAPGSADEVNLNGDRAEIRAECVRRALELLAFALGAAGVPVVQEQAGSGDR